MLAGRSSFYKETPIFSVTVKGPTYLWSSFLTVAVSLYYKLPATLCPQRYTLRPAAGLRLHILLFRSRPILFRPVGTPKYLLFGL
jgi:hypothetical protein